MTVDNRLNEFRQVRDEISAMHNEWKAGTGDGGGAGGGGMEQRIGKLESSVDKLDDRFHDLSDKLAGVRVDVATLAERVKHLPSKGFIVTTTVTTLGFFSAIVLFADRIKALIGG